MRTQIEIESELKTLTQKCEKQLTYIMECVKSNKKVDRTYVRDCDKNGLRVNELRSLLQSMNKVNLN